MHPVLKALALTSATIGGLAAAAPASAHTSVGFFVGSGYPGWGGYGYAPAYWGPPPVYWGPPVYGYGWGYSHYPRYWHGGWGHRGWGYRGYRHWRHW